MLDVIHYYYEEDMNYSTVEQAQMSEARRIHVFEDLYEETYKYKSGKSTSSYKISEDGMVSKPYIPPTSIDETSPMPFGDVLDSPLG